MELFIKNSLRISELGLGDGTVYYSATIPTTDANADGIPDAINPTDKTFDLTPITKILDLPALVDDALNGHILYFPASGNKYHIVDFVASTEVVTVWEVPDINDTGPCEVRRALLDNNTLAGNPLLYATDGRRDSKWKPSGATTIEVNLPNIITNGGFESATLSPWIIAPVGGTADSSGLNTAGPILGASDLKLNLGDRTSVTLLQTLRNMKKSTTYKLIFKARHTGVFVQSDFDVRFAGHTGDELVASNPSSGTANLNTFQPLLTTSNTWHSAEFKTPAYEIIASNLQVILSGSFDVFIDEFYLFESVNVAAMCAFDHGGYFQLDKISGRNAASIRTGQTNGIDFFDFIPSSIKFLSGNAGIKEIAIGVFPVYSISVQNVTGISELLLCEKWAWLHGPNRGSLDFENTSYDEVKFKTRNGTTFTTRLSQERLFKDTYPSMPESERLRLINDWKPYHRDDLYPFAVKLRTGDSPLLMIENGSSFNNPYKNISPDWPFSWVEVL